MSRIECPGKNLGKLAEIVEGATFRPATRLPVKTEVVALPGEHFDLDNPEDAEQDYRQQLETFERYSEHRRVLTEYTGQELGELDDKKREELRRRVRGYLVAHSHRCPDCKDERARFVDEQAQGFRTDSRYSLARAKRKLEKMYFGIPCPGKNINELLKALEPEVLGCIVKSTQTSGQELRDAIEKNFPWVSEKLRKGLLLQKRKENLFRRKLYLIITRFAEYVDSVSGNLLMDYSNGLGLHVQYCTGDEKCFDRYMMFLEEKARESLKSDRSLPKKIRRLDRKYLDLSDL